MRIWLIFLITLSFPVLTSWSNSKQDSLISVFDTTENLQTKLTLIDSLYENYDIQGDQEKALYYARIRSQLKDSLFNLNLTESSKRINQESGITEITEKISNSYHTIEQAKKKQSYLTNLIQKYKFLSVCFLLVIIFALYKLVINWHKKSKINEQKKEILAKYNSLESAFKKVHDQLEKLNARKPLEYKSHKSEIPDWVVKLSKKELEVLSYLSIGMTDKEISQKMSISLSTVRTYCRRIYGKLLVKNRSEAANFAQKYNLV